MILLLISLITGEIGFWFLGYKLAGSIGWKIFFYALAGIFDLLSTTVLLSLGSKEDISPQNVQENTNLQTQKGEQQ